MHAIILAAGRGSRMGARAGGGPKCLLRVGGRSLIEYQCAVLRGVGVGSVAIVVGFPSDLERARRETWPVIAAR